MGLDQNQRVELLLVEDDEDFKSAMSVRLEKRNFGVTTVTTAEEGLERIGEKEFDVVVTDIRLPGMSGTEFLAEAKKIKPELPVILVTGYANLDSAREAVALNASDYLMKPLIKIEELLHPIRRAVRGYRLARQNRRLFKILKGKTQDLLASEQRYRDLFDSAGDVIIIADTQDRLVAVNRRTEEITGFRNDELAGRPVSDLLSSIEEGAYEEKSKGVLAGNARDTVEVRLKVKTGLPRIAELGMRPIKAGGKVTGMQCILRDITDRKIGELDIRHLKEYYETVVSTIPSAILVVDRSLKIKAANETFTRMFGGKETEVLQEHVADVFDRALGDKLRDLTGDGRRLKEPVRFEWTTVGRSGEAFCAEVTLKEIGLDGRSCLLMIMSDITELRRAEEEKRGMEAHFLEMQKMEAVGQLAGGIAHDVKNSLTPILGSAELIEDAVRDRDGKLAEYAAVIIRCAGRANELTRQLLTFARRGRYEETTFDLHAVIGEMIRFLEHSLDKRIRVESFLEAQNPVMRGDPTQIHQMLLNLALNAKDAMPEGGLLTFSTKTVRLDAEFCERDRGLRPGEHVELVVADSGCGMSGDVKKRVFEPFFTTKPVGQGTGLGLSSVYGFVMMHNGAIAVESEPGCGTRFTVHFPLSTAGEIPGGWEDVERAIQTGRGTVLIVDDEEEIRRVLRAQLERFGYRAKECADGVEALEFYRRHGRDVDAVILDVVMPRSSGVECFARMKMINPDVKVLLMSGYAVDEQCRTLLDSGARGFIEKPFGEEEVSRKLAEVLAQ